MGGGGGDEYGFKPIYLSCLQMPVGDLGQLLEDSSLNDSLHSVQVPWDLACKQQQLNRSCLLYMLRTRQLYTSMELSKLTNGYLY
jgi:hypothetical protein